MADQEALLQALRSFAITMGSIYDMPEMSHQLCERVTDVMSATGAGVSVADADDNLRFVTATDEVIVEMEEAQEQSQQGPCVEAFHHRQPVAVNDVRSLSDWPVYRAIAEKLELHAVVGYPLSYNGQRLGALNLYNAEPRDWTEEDLDVIGVFADMATAYLVRVSELSETRRLAAQLQEALDSRVLIEQAKGIIAGELGVSVDEAFELLRRHGRNNNLKLVELSHAVVDLGLRIPERSRGE